MLRGTAPLGEHDAAVTVAEPTPAVAALVTVPFLSYDEALAVLGARDGHLRLLERAFGVTLVLRGTELEIQGEAVAQAQVLAIITELQGLVRRGQKLTSDEVRYAVGEVKALRVTPAGAVFTDVVLTTHRGKQIKPKSAHQHRYVEAMRRDDLVFAIGPAGTGKTYLAVASACEALLNKRVQRIILTRPAVEAGEKLGFLPGDLQEKINPYLRPLYDALYDMLEMERVERLLEKKVIEVAPLAFMRGRTLNDAYIIMDEAQNTTPEQMKMFLTRLGYGSRAVVTGDITQIDLPSGQRSGLVEIRRILRDVAGLSFLTFDDTDVVRHPLVQRIVRAYEAQEPRRDAGIPT
jgi:phosphate starvation-inducible protein PhoH and related proteins